MLRYLTVTRCEVRIFSTSPLLPVLITKGGALRASVEVSVPGGGPKAPEHPLNDVSLGGSPVISRLKTPSTRTGSPAQIPWMVIVRCGADAVLFVFATTFTAAWTPQGPVA